LVDTGAVAGFIGDSDFFAATDTNPFEVFTAENSTRTTATIDTVSIIGNDRIFNEILTSRSDDQGAVEIAGSAADGQDIG